MGFSCYSLIFHGLYSVLRAGAKKSWCPRAGVPADRSWSGGWRAGVPADRSWSGGWRAGVPMDGPRSMGWRAYPEPVEGSRF
jgi:hypothetical protein